MSTIKAFLSHSSEDKEFVNAVALELGRQYCIYDERVFYTGNDFKESIEHGLDSSAVFVLFASENSLLSDWVNFEIGESWYKKLERGLQKHLVYIITDSVEIEDIPIWLRRAKIQRGNIAKIIAREIRGHIDILIGERQNPFVGRNKDVQNMEESLTPADLEPPHIFFVTGLPGIGRRSLIERTIKSSLDLKPLKKPLRLGEGFSIQDICTIVADLIEPYSTDLRFQQIMREIQSLSEEDALNRTLVNLRTMTNSGELPIFLDEGGLFDSDGNISDPIKSIMKSISPNDEAYIAIVSARRPPFTIDSSIPIIRVDPLDIEDQKLLIRTLDKKYISQGYRRKTKLTSIEVSDLASYTAGYPPSAYAAMAQVEEYGIDLVLANKATFVELRIDHFIKHFSTQNISEDEQNILCLLANYSPLPLITISLTLSRDIRDIGDCMTHLIDLSFIVVEGKTYRVSDPVVDAAIKTFGSPKLEIITSLANSIIKIIDSSDFEEYRLDLHRILYRAAWYLKDPIIKDRVFHLFNDLIKIIKSLYDKDRNYLEVIAVTEVALNQCKSKLDYETIITYRAKSFINEEKWKEAEQEIEDLKQYAPTRNTYYLKGLMYRKKGETSEAISAYLESRRCGRTDESINRELGSCYFYIGEYNKANECLKEVLNRQKDKKRVNFYSLDLQAQIAIALKDKALAEQSIEQLKDTEIDKSSYYYRKSKFEFALGDKRLAEEYAEKAKSSNKDNPRFQTLANLAFCKIINGKNDEAERVIDEIGRRNCKVGSTNFDICQGLRTRLAIARKRYEDAFRLSSEIKNNSTKSYKGIRRDAIQGYLINCALTDINRTKLESELAILKSELSNIDEIAFEREIDSYCIDID
jgi:tetratricopeptide (TPR) repeat protein